VIAPVQRLVSAVILLGWLAPGVSTLGFALHLDLAHRGADARHETELADLLRAAVHGHHHDFESDRDHDHPVRLSGQIPASRPDLGLTAPVLSALSSPTTDPAQVAVLDRVLRRGPPRPLFTVHCMLLI